MSERTLPGLARLDWPFAAKDGCVVGSHKFLAARRTPDANLGAAGNSNVVTPIAVAVFVLDQISELDFDHDLAAAQQAS